MQRLGHRRRWRTGLGAPPDHGVRWRRPAAELRQSQGRDLHAVTPRPFRPACAPPNETDTVQNQFRRGSRREFAGRPRCLGAERVVVPIIEKASAGLVGAVSRAMRIRPRPAEPSVCESAQPPLPGLGRSWAGRSSDGCCDTVRHEVIAGLRCRTVRTIRTVSCSKIDWAWAKVISSSPWSS